jgi:type II secretory pathway pseudopilin PulG
MKRVSGVSQPAGYTIVEALIFLAVSGMLAVSALLLVGAQQGKTEFSQSVREMELIVQDVMNDVSTGNFPSPGAVSCTLARGQPQVTVGAGEQGTNSQCILIGRVIQFRPNTGNSDYRTFSVAGIKGSIDNLSKNLNEATPRIIQQTARTTRIPYGIQVLSVTGAGCSPYAIGFFTNFATYSLGALNSGARNVDVVPFCSVGGGVDDAPVASAIANAGTVPANPSSGLTICLSDGGSRRGVIVIGGGGQQFTTRSEIGAGLC